MRYVARKLQPATLLKLTLLNGCFARFLNCTNGTKSLNASHLLSFFSVSLLHPTSIQVPLERKTEIQRETLQLFTDLLFGFTTNPNRNTLLIFEKSLFP